MKTATIVLFLIGAMLLSGCAHNYVMTLNNGMRVTTASKPKLKGGIYYFKDAAGRDAFVSAGRVREIAPASMAVDEKTRFNPSTGK